MSRLDNEAAARLGDDGVGMPVSDGKTIAEINKAVVEGLQLAADVVAEDPELQVTHRQLLKTWEKVCGDFLVVGAGIAGMKYRTAEQIRIQLRQAKNKIEETTASDFLTRFKYSGMGGH